MKLFGFLCVAIVSFVSIVTLPKYILLQNYIDLAFRIMHLFQSNLIPVCGYANLLIFHIALLVLAAIPRLPRRFIVKQRKKIPHRQAEWIFTRAHDFPYHIVENLKSILRELKIDYKFVSVESNGRVLSCNVKLKKTRQIINLQGYFLKNKDIHSVRIAKPVLYRNVAEIEVGYAPEAPLLPFHTEIFMQNKSQIFMTLGKDMQDIVFVEKLSSLGVFGKKSCGKTNLLRQIAVSLMQQSNPLELFLPREFGDLLQYSHNKNTILYDSFSLIKTRSAGAKVVIIDDIQDKLSDLQNAMGQNKHVHYIVATSMVYSDFLKHAFSRKAVFKLNESLEKQYISTKDLPNEGLLDFDDYYYITPKQTYRIVTSLSDIASSAEKSHKLA